MPGIPPLPGRRRRRGGRAGAERGVGVRRAAEPGSERGGLRRVPAGRHVGAAVPRGCRGAAGAPPERGLAGGAAARR